MTFRGAQRAFSGPGWPGLTAAVWLLALAALAWFLWRILLPNLFYNSLGFPTYYTAGRLVLSGGIGPHIYDQGWFYGAQAAHGLRTDIFGPQPPTMALLMLPVAWLPPGAARAAWISVSLGCVGGIWLLMRRLAAAPQGDWLGLALGLLLVAAYRPLHAELRYAQVYSLLALCYALWFYGYVRGRDGLCGAALAVLALAKLAGWPLWLLLALDRRSRALLWAAGTGAAVALLSLPALGLDTWRAYLATQIAVVAGDPVFGVTAVQTIIGLLRQLFVYDATWTPAPLVHAPELARVLWWLAAALLLVPTLRGRRGERLLSGAALLCAVVPLQPGGEQHHYTMLLAPLLLVIGLRSRLPWSPAAAALALAAAVLLTLPPNYFLDNAAWAGWPRALLAYPRLYAALLLWGALLLWRGKAFQTGAAMVEPFVRPAAAPTDAAPGLIQQR